MRATAARLFLLTPGWWYFLFSGEPGVQKWTFKGMLIASAIWYGFLCWLDSTRRPPRCPISVMVARMLMFFTVVSFCFLVILPVRILSPDWCLMVGLILTTAYVSFFLFIHFLGHLFIYPHVAENYYTTRAAGWHPFWDTKWRIFNPDSELIRNGGFEEPEYTDFVPPADWQFQCPVCGARQPFDEGICWMCGYGADGNSDAYYERWGDE